MVFSLEHVGLALYTFGMTRSIDLVPVSLLDDQYLKAFSLSTGHTPELTESIRRYGLLSPLLVLPGERLILWDGFVRLSAAIDAGISQVPIYQTPLSVLEAVSTRLLDPRFMALASIQKVSMVSRLSLLGFKDMDLHALLPLLGLPPTTDMLHKLKKIDLLSEPLKQFSEEKRLPLKHLFRLSTLSGELQDVFVTLVSHLPLSASVAFECVDALVDLSKRRQLSAQALLSEPSFTEIFASQGTEADKIHRLREALNQLKTPLLYQKNLAIETQLDSLVGPFKISWDKSFEKKEVHLTLALKKESDIKTLAQHVQEPTLQSTLHHILEAF